MSRKLRSGLGRSTPDQIFVRGHDLAADILGKVNLGDVAFLELKGRLPNHDESVMFNALLVTLVEHGITPSTIAARLTYFGAPEALQAAVAAGLLGMGDRFGGSIEQAARMLQDSPAGADLRTTAREIVEAHRAGGQMISGLGHPVHKPVDPRTVRLFELAQTHGFARRHVQLMELIAEEATAAYGRDLPVNATGAIAAIATEMELPWRITRGLAVMARAIGLVAHLQEEMDDPMAGEIWSRADAEASGDNPSRRA